MDENLERGLRLRKLSARLLGLSMAMREADLGLDANAALVDKLSQEAFDISNEIIPEPFLSAMKRERPFQPLTRHPIP